METEHSISNMRARLAAHTRVVVKIGTTTLTYPNGRLNLQRIERICTVLADLCNQGKEMMLVTSGAIAVGADRLSMAERPRDILGKQAASAVGQAILMQIYQRYFTMFNRQIAQILLTKDVVDNAIRRQNARNTLFTLLSMGVLPVINENDSVSTDELEFSDNDTLSAHVATLTDSGLLVILSDIDGLYDADPKREPSARIFHEVAAITPELEQRAGASSSKLGTGGMAAKLNAAKMTVAKGIDTVIASGENPDVLWRIMAGQREGTLFVGKCNDIDMGAGAF